MKTMLSILAKAGIALAIFGFFQPVACDQNAFKLAEMAQETGKTLGGFGANNTQLSLALYAGIGLVFLAALIALVSILKGFPQGIELLQTVAIFLAGAAFTYAFISLNKDLDLQRGAWFIMGGVLTAFVLGLISLGRKKRR